MPLAFTKFKNKDAESDDSPQPFLERAMSPYFTTSLPHRRYLIPFPCAALLAFLTLASIGCGGSADAGAEAPRSAAGTGTDDASNSSGVPAAKAASVIDKGRFSTVLPEGWEILADDFDRMGLVTLAKVGTGGSQGVYLKFEKGFNGDPMKNIEKAADRYEGSTPETSVRAGISWARTRYTYAGVTQSLNITAHNGEKVTFTVMGDDYDTSPGVKAIFDGLKLK